MDDFIFEHSSTLAEFEFWRTVFLQNEQRFHVLENSDHYKPLPPTFASGERKDFIGAVGVRLGRDDWDMLVEAVRQIQEEGLW